MTKRTCSIENCDRPYCAKGYCKLHYYRAKNGLDMGAPARMHRRENLTCAMAGCNSPARGYKWCNKHYKRWAKYGDPSITKPRVRGTCSVDGCDEPHDAKGYCGKHYAKWHAGRDPEVVTIQQYPSRGEAFYANTEWRGDCLEWTGATNENGYGILSVYGTRTRVHRWVFEMFKGEIPEGLYIDHRCGNTSCVNIDHLRLATPTQNMENLTKIRSDNTSGYRGVYFAKDKGRWYARAFHHGAPHYGGYFDTAEEANEAAIRLRNRLYTHNDRDRAA